MGTYYHRFRSLSSSCGLILEQFHANSAGRLRLDDCHSYSYGAVSTAHWHPRFRTEVVLASARISHSGMVDGEAVASLSVIVWVGEQL